MTGNRTVKKSTKAAAAKKPATAAKAESSTRAAEKQLDEFLSSFTPEVAATAKQALKKMRARLPGAIELVYDNYNALAIGFASTERASDAIFSIALYPRWVSLFFLQNGTKLRDPECLLKGDGNKVRHIVLENVAILDDPAVIDLMGQEQELARKQIDPSQPRRMIIKSVAAKQRPRRPS
jgi:hypothetical protein